MIVIVLQLEKHSRASKIKISVMCKRAKELMSEHSVAGELMAYRLSCSDCLTLIHCI